MATWFAGIVAPNGNGREGVEGVFFLLGKGQGLLRVTSIFFFKGVPGDGVRLKEFGYNSVAIGVAY